MTLKCKYCSKVFEKAATGKRHQYYCFHKQNEPQTSRKRSCTTCTRAKTRCDQQFPSCGRCQAKGRQCQYEGRELDNNFESTENALEMSRQFSHAKLDVLVASENVYTNLSSETDSFFAWPALKLHLPITSSGNSLRLMSGPFGKKIGLSPMNGMLMMALKSLLHVISQNHRYVPFVHPNQHWDQSLIRCQDIIHRYFSANHSSGSIWHEIRQEHERIWFSHDSMNGFQLLSALQALLIYCLLRAAYGSSSDLDLPLILSVKEVASHLGKLYSSHTRRETLGYQEIAYEEWKFMETWARTLTMFLLMWLVWDMDDLGSCDRQTEFKLAPLPVHDLLWQARSAGQWKSLYDARETVVHGITHEGVLVKLGCTGSGLIWSEPSWEAWIAEVGEIGMLCGMAAQILKPVVSTDLDGEVIKQLLPDKSSAQYWYIENSIHVAMTGGL